MEEYFLLHYIFIYLLLCKSICFQLQKIRGKSLNLNVPQQIFLTTFYSVNEAGGMTFPPPNKWRFQMKIPFTLGFPLCWEYRLKFSSQLSSIFYVFLGWVYFLLLSSCMAANKPPFDFFCPKIKSVGNSLGFFFSKCCTI